MYSVIIHGSLGGEEGHFLFQLPEEELTLVLGFWELFVMVPKPIRHNPGVSQTLIISSHGFCEYPWLSRSEGGPFTFHLPGKN